MSAICGLWMQNGEPVQEEAMTSMMDALAHRGPDGSGVWRSGPVALGHQMLHITPESLNETLPLHDPTRRLTITADARIDNRDELFATLGVPLTERTGMPDSTLILYAYSKWRDRCVEHLEGSFTFAIWDSAHQQLVCVTDPMGAQPLYYFSDHRQFVFASEIKGILAVPGIPRQLNEKRLLGTVLDYVYCEEPFSTHYAEIWRIPPATIFKVASGELQQNEYWRPDPTRRLPYKTDSEILEALRELLFRTMKAYTRSAFPVAAMFSGGLDSSAVVSVAARVLADSGKKLIAISAVLPKKGAPAGYQDEREFIDLAKGWSNVDLVYDMAEGRGPFDDLDRIIRNAEHPGVSPHSYQMASFAEHARNRGARVILTGFGGECGLTLNAHGYLAELLISGRWITLWREARALAIRESRPLWRVFRREALAPLSPGWVWHWLRDSLSPADRATLKAQPLSDSLLAKLLGGPNSIHSLETLAVRPYRRSSAHHRTNQLKNIMLTRSLFYGSGFVQCSHEPVVGLSPLLDKRVIEFCLAAPGHLKMRNGYRRYLVRASLADILPPAIQSRTTKGSAVLDIAERYNRQLPQVRKEVEAISPADPVRAVVDVNKLRHLAASPLASGDAAWGEKHKLVNLWAVPQGIYLIRFLRQFDAFRA